MENKLVAGIVAAAIAVIVLAGVLMPALSDATTTTDTFTNGGYFDITYTEEDDVTVSWDYSKPNVATVNGEEIQLPTVGANQVINIACGDDWFLRYGTNVVQFFTSTATSVSASVNDGTSLTLTASNGTASVTNTASTPATATVSYTFIYVVSDDGDYVMKKADEKVYLNGDSEVYAIGRSSTTGLILKLKITGTIDDGFTPTVISPDTATAGDTTAVYTEDSTHKDLYLLEQINVPITYGDNQSYTAMYSYFIVPAEVTAERSVHLSDAMNMILNVIPLLIIVAILLGVVAYVIYKRNE